MNDSDTGFIASEKIKLTDNPDNASILTTEANVHVVDKGNWNAKFLHILERIAFLRAEFPINLKKVLQFLISTVLIELLV